MSENGLTCTTVCLLFNLEEIRNGLITLCEKNLNLRLYSGTTRVTAYPQAQVQVSCQPWSGLEIRKPQCIWGMYFSNHVLTV